MTELLKLVYVAPRRSTLFASLIWLSLNLVSIFYSHGYFSILTQF